MSLFHSCKNLLAWSLLGGLLFSGMKLGMLPNAIDWNQGSPTNTPNHFEPPRQLAAITPSSNLDTEMTDHNPGMVPPTPAAVVQSDITDLSGLIYPELGYIAATEDLAPGEAVMELIYWSADPDPVIRLAAVEAMADVNQSDSISALLDIASFDPDRHIRITAIEALAMRRDANIALKLEPLLYDPDRQVRIAAIEALADLEQSDAVASLTGLLGDSDAEVRRHAVAALGEFDDTASDLYLLAMSTDSEADIRDSAAAILRERFTLDP